MTMPPSSGDVDAMARIMQAMNGTGPSLNAAPTLAPAGAAAPVSAAGDHINPTSDMMRLIQAMNEGVSLDELPPPPAPTLPQQVERMGGSHVDPAVNAMQNILDMFKTSGDPASAMAERSLRDPRLAEAMVTETTDNGVRVGSWEISITEANGLKFYSVSNIHTGEPIASDLTLYDAAKGIASALNEGMTINTPTIRKLLNAEGAYSRARQNAAEFRQSMQIAESRGDRQKRAIAEDRFNEALARAKEARATLTRLVD